ncbi:hypothetical protein HMPREF1508_1018 [Shuttleworthella sp. MSX8B]|nr:hypothetical protein HMPREF1508_1018 [Shuttleworthia sp. MSX8B]
MTRIIFYNETVGSSGSFSVLVGDVLLNTCLIGKRGEAYE